MKFELDGKHLLEALALGVLAGVLIVVLDGMLVQRLENAIGVIPAAA